MVVLMALLLAACLEPLRAATLVVLTVPLMVESTVVLSVFVLAVRSGATRAVSWAGRWVVLSAGLTAEPTVVRTVAMMDVLMVVL